MRRTLFLLMLSGLMMAVSAVFAGQDLAMQPAFANQTEQDIINRADSVVKQFNPALGQATLWTYSYTVASNDGSLGCPLAASYNLGYYVTPYRVELSYGTQGPYVVYVSFRNGVGDISVPCDPKLGASAGGGGTSAPGTGSICTATALYGRNVAIYSAPGQADSVLGTLNDYAYLPVVGRTADTGSYQVTIGGLAGWVSFFDVTLGGSACSTLPVTSQTTSSGFSVENFTGTGGVFTCSLSAIQARVRSAPVIGAPILDEVVSGEIVGVVGKNAGQDADLWYQVSTPAGNGWVSSTVSTLSGAGCAGLSVTAGTLTTNADGQQFNVALPPLSTNCPAGYEGLLQPRLVAGSDAVVLSETLRVRTEPLPRADETNVVFQLPAGTVFQVVTGPVCEGPRVWWQVSLNNVIGWLAESDAPTGYYVEPRVNAPGVRFDAPLLGVTAEIGRVETGGNVATIAFTSDGDAIAVANGADSFIRAWDTETGNTVTNNFLHQPDVRLTYVAYQPGGDLVAVADATRTVSIWQNGQLINFLGGRFEPLFPGDVAVSPDWSNVAISGCVRAENAICTQYAVNVIDIVTNETLKSYEVPGARSIAYSADASTLYAVSGSGVLTVIDAVSGEMQTIETGYPAVRDLALTPSGEVALIAKADAITPYSVYVWNADAVVNTITLDTDITSFAFSPDGALLALGDSHNTVALWDLNTNKSLETFAGYINGITSLTFSTDSQILASGDNAGNLVLLNVGTE